jgi:hypothetical protein
VEKIPSKGGTTIAFNRLGDGPPRSTAHGIGFALTKHRLAADFETADRIAGIVTKAVAES